MSQETTGTVPEGGVVTVKAKITETNDSATPVTEESSSSPKSEESTDLFAVLFLVSCIITVVLTIVVCCSVIIVSVKVLTTPC